MTTTMQLIAKQTVGAGGAASVTFSNIPQTYTDLKVVISSRNVSGEHLLISFNGSTSNFSGRYLNGYGGSVGAGSYARYLGNGEPASYTANTFGSAEVYIPNYTSANYKSVSSDTVSESNSSTDYALVMAGNLWSTTSAITSITFNNENGTGYSQYSTFYLYGISNSTTTQATTVPYASGGDVITTDGSYWYHTFLYSGTFTPLKELTCDYLVVAGGGGGGGSNSGGGGGAGGYRTSIGGTPLSLTAQAYTATIGAGAAATNEQRNANNGNDSVFASITSTGGGGAGGGNATNTTGNNGGSGGGANYNTTSGYGLGNTPSTSPSQGNNGAAGIGAVSPYSGGGGGGAGAAASGKNGGVGVSNSISGSAVYYAGGGGGGDEFSGGAGGNGGGANGATPGGTGGSGSANTGGGGGGSWSGNYGGAGGSGIIIVRYAV